MGHPVFNLATPPFPDLPGFGESSRSPHEASFIWISPTISLFFSSALLPFPGNRGLNCAYHIIMTSGTSTRHPVLSWMLYTLILTTILWLSKLSSSFYRWGSKGSEYFSKAPSDRWIQIWNFLHKNSNPFPRTCAWSPGWVGFYDQFPKPSPFSSTHLESPDLCIVSHHWGIHHLQGNSEKELLFTAQFPPPAPHWRNCKDTFRIL